MDIHTGTRQYRRALLRSVNKENQESIVNGLRSHGRMSESVHTIIDVGVHNKVAE